MQIAPYLRFNDDKCREAMTFYKECLGADELTFQTIGETPMANEMPEDQRGKIMHAMLKKGSVEFYASDMMRDKATVGDSMAMCVNVDSKEEADQIFNKLSVGGEIFMPMENAFWGAYFGVTTDKYGVEWMINCGLPKQ